MNTPIADPVLAARVRAAACAIERAREALASVVAELRRMAGDLPPALPLADEACGPGELPTAGEPGGRGKVAP